MGILKEGIIQPKGYIKLGTKHLVCKLKNAFYNLYHSLKHGISR
jgi:hypothetical protein